MTLIIRLVAMALVLQTSLAVGTAAIETVQAATDARAAAFCQVDSKYCK